jgi:hypothetical protein
MKKTILHSLCGLLIASAMSTAAFAQTVVRETTATNAAGTITEFGPEQIIVRSETSPAPVRYISRKTTTYVDDTGAPVSVETVKSGLPVTVYYTREGDDLVASRVVVRRTAAVVPAAPVIEKQTTTTTTTTKKAKDDDDDND